MSGDMTLGALVDAGVALSSLSDELSRLPVKGYKLTSRSVKRAGMRATKVDVDIQKAKGRGQGARKWKDIEKIIRNSTLSAPIKQKGLLIFKRLFEAEARVHGERFDRIHLHELGAVDCIVDIFGSLIGLDILGIDTVYASSINLGRGSVQSEHGTLPVPAPASVQLLRGVPVYSSDVSFELTTPTGAVLISSLAAGFGPMPGMNISKIGIGAGDKNFREQPNILRLFIGSAETPVTGVSRGGGMQDDSVVVVETNIDDMTPQVYEYIMDKLFRAGALDVFLTQIIMKKGRPGVKVTLLSEEDKKDGLCDILMKETTSIGLRFYRADRKILHREIASVNTPYGKVRVKKAKLDSDTFKVSPEYEDCRKIAKKFNIPFEKKAKM